jgi:deoxyribodipyrimidine photolyase
MERHAGEEARLVKVHSRIKSAIEEMRRGREQRRALEEQAKHFQDLAKEEALKKKNLQLKASREAASLRELEKLLEFGSKTYSIFTWEDMESATSSFSEALKIGSGSVGTVYKGKIHNTTVAIKVLNSNDSHITKHFEQEV